MNIGPTETVEIACEVVRTSGDAWMISDGTCEVWINKRQISSFAESHGLVGKWVSSIFIPAWLAREKGLI
jgi:hypothetical protein